ncbi:MAG: hypothetical protein JXR88_00755 [Clostridia bacterium]|nr:hypothetical protein [Clostridia bacterium]
MNISMNNLNSYITQLTQGNSSYSTSNLQRAFQSQTGQRDDKMEISAEGRMMSQMMKREERREEMEAHKVAFQEAYTELDLANLDTENMTDDEIQEVLTAFETAMADHMPEDYKPASEMNSSELRETLSNIQSMQENISSGKGQYGPPPRGPGGPGGPGGGQGMNVLDALTSEDDEEEDDLISSLLEALNSSEDITSGFSIKSMTEILNLIGQYNNN